MVLEDWIWPVFILILSGLVFTMVYLVIKFIYAEKHQMRPDEVAISKIKTFYPLQLKAYERLIFCLERISPRSLIYRVNKGSMTSAELQLELLRSIREEFEHNVSMQMYVSDRAWGLIVAAREEISDWVRKAAAKTGPTASGLELSQRIFEFEAEKKTSVVAVAIATLKHELRKDLEE